MNYGRWICFTPSVHVLASLVPCFGNTKCFTGLWVIKSELTDVSCKFPMNSDGTGHAGGKCKNKASNVNIQ